MDRNRRRDAKPVDISIVIPLLDEKESLRPLTRKIQATMEADGRPYEIIFVDDGSTDGSDQVLADLHESDAAVKVIHFRRNFGKSAAYSAAFERAAGRYVVTMDADLQDEPAEIPGLIAKVEEGYDLVSGWKKKRQDSLAKVLPSRFFNWATRLFYGIPIHDFNCGLKAYRTEVVRDIKIYGELHRYIPVLAHLEGYRIGERPVRHHPRRFGVTKYGWTRLLKGFLDLLTVMYLGKFMGRPLHLFGTVGVILALSRMRGQRVYRVTLDSPREYPASIPPPLSRRVGHRVGSTVRMHRPDRRHDRKELEGQRELQRQEDTGLGSPYAPRDATSVETSG